MNSWNDQIFNMIRGCKQEGREEYKEWTYENCKILNKSKAPSVPYYGIHKAKVIADFILF